MRFLIIAHSNGNESINHGRFKEENLKDFNADLLRDLQCYEFPQFSHFHGQLNFFIKVRLSLK
jgi:hypothetical protein